MTSNDAGGSQVVLDGLTRAAPSLETPPGRLLSPRAPALRPKPTAPHPLMDPGTLRAHREDINRAATAGRTEPLHVVLYALTLPGRSPDDDLAACQGHAIQQGLAVNDRIVDTIKAEDRNSAEKPTLRRGYSLALHLLSAPGSPVQGLIAVSQTAITPADHLYQDQLRRIANHNSGLWLVRPETAY